MILPPVENRKNFLLELSTGVGSIVYNKNTSLTGIDLGNVTLKVPVEFFASFKIGYRFGK